MLPDHLAAVSGPDRDLIYQAIGAAADGPFFPDWEFHALMGLWRPEMAAVAEAWPHPPSPEVVGGEPLHLQMLAVDNALNNLAGYPHQADDELLARLGTDRAELTALLGRWKSDAVRSRSTDGEGPTSRTV